MYDFFYKISTFMQILNIYKKKNALHIAVRVKIQMR
jgi:hypothetical protein